ncbi:MAG TPA: diguanylate cyclase [Pilimelia sp.]|nr:diguanylate cyclase [Pilimelia sp.]
MATTVALAAYFAADLGGTAAQVRVFWLFQVSFDLALTWVCRALARHPATTRPQRRVWLALGLAGLAFAAGDATQGLLTLGRVDPAASVYGNAQAATYLVGIGGVLVVLLTYPTGARTRAERLRFWLDAGTVLVGAGAFAWYLGVSPGATGTDVVQLLLGSGLVVVAAFAVVKMLLAGDGPITRQAAVPAIAAALIQGGGNAVMPANLDTPYLHLMLIVRLLPAVLIVLGPRIQFLQVAAGAAGQGQARAPRRFSVLPYVMAAAAYAALVAALPPGLDLRAAGVLTGAMLVNVLVVARQLLAIPDNSRLLGQVDRSLADLRRHERRLRSLLRHSSDITLVAGPDGRLTYVSPAVTRILGHQPEAILGRPIIDYVHAEDAGDPHVVSAVERLTRLPGATVTFQARHRHADGSWRWLEVISTNLCHEPDMGGFVSNAREVTEARELQDRLRHQASHDPLTGLANRGLFTEHLLASVAAGQRAGTPVSVLVIDLDDFKSINDSLGHHAGDAALGAVASRLRGCVRHGDTAARIGGDEFAALLPGASAAEAATLAERFLDSLADPVLTDGHVLTVRASVGIAAAAGGDPDALLRAADAAMYAAKQQGKGRYALSERGAATREPAGR